MNWKMTALCFLTPSLFAGDHIEFELMVDRQQGRFQSLQYGNSPYIAHYTQDPGHLDGFGLKVAINMLPLLGGSLQAVGSYHTNAQSEMYWGYDFWAQGVDGQYQHLVSKTDAGKFGDEYGSLGFRMQWRRSVIVTAEAEYRWEWLTLRPLEAGNPTDRETYHRPWISASVALPFQLLKQNAKVGIFVGAPLARQSAESANQYNYLQPNAPKSQFGFFMGVGF